MNYTAYHFTVIPAEPGTEILMALIAEMGFDSFEPNEQGFTAWIREEDEVNVDLKDLSFPDFVFFFSKERVEQKNWNTEWEKNFSPVEVGDELLIRAPFHSTDRRHEHEIVIMPKMSFGTGHHQTTRLMCAALLRQDLHGRTVLDMGCGTGILAILAKKLGASEITAVDIDEWCVENSLENCKMNDAGDINVLKGDADILKGLGPFAVIIANINRNILKKQLPVYAEVIKKGGVLLLSGFFTTDAAELQSYAQQHGFRTVSVSNDGEWAMITLQMQ